MKKATIKLRFNDGTWPEAEGYLFDAHGIELFVHRTDKKHCPWGVTEPKTGYRIGGSGNTRGESVENAKALVKIRTPEKVLELIEKAAT